MNILVINNYSMKHFLALADDNIVPAHHCWGCDELRNQSNVKLKFALYKIPKVFLKLHFGRLYYYILQFFFLYKAIGCSCIYVAASPLIDLIGFLKYIGCYKKKLVVVVHHPRNFSLKNQRYDKLIFICKEAYEQALLDYPEFKDSFLFQEWGPDLRFYEGMRANVERVSFVSNGITNRDNYTLIEASKGTTYPIGILCNQQSLPSNYDSSLKNIDLVFNKGTMMNGKIMSYTKMIAYVSQYASCVIPTGPEQKSLCGLTSFCDAIALGMPIILSTTTRIDVDFKRYPFGYYYKAGDFRDLRMCMDKMSDVNNLRKMSLVARQYAEDHDYRRFAKTICDTILH